MKAQLDVTDICSDCAVIAEQKLRADWILFTNVPLATRLVNYRLLNAGYLRRPPVRKPLQQKKTPTSAVYVGTWAIELV